MATIPEWALDALQCPDTGAPLHLDGDCLVTSDGIGRAAIVDGVVRFVLPGEDPSIRYYHAVGGAHFYERSQVGYAMTTLDTTVYRCYLEAFRPDDRDAMVVDVGGGDGRHAWPWLEWGHQRIVITDAAGDALRRFRSRIAEHRPDWLERILMVEADARRLPLKSRSAGRVLSIEALAYLNDDYGTGLGECARVMADEGRLLVADRDYEGALLVNLFYSGVRGLIEQAGGRHVWDRNGEHTVRSRCFTANELAAEVTAVGLRVVDRHGISALSLILGYLRNTGTIGGEADAPLLPDVHRLLATLGREGAMRRSNVIIAERPRP